MPFKIVFTFYLKHGKFPFCAPIIRPLSETESQRYCIQLYSDYKSVLPVNIEFIIFGLIIPLGLFKPHLVFAPSCLPSLYIREPPANLPYLLPGHLICFQGHFWPLLLNPPHLEEPNTALVRRENGKKIKLI